MHDAAVLDRFIPEFGSLRHLVIYEPYHKYTVDEHTLISIKNLENLKNTKDERSLYLREILRDIKLEVLFLAILLHDVGKGIKSNAGRKHEEKGYKAIKGILERFELSASDRHRIEFLVKNHVILSKLALTRDSDAQETITNLCEIAENEENLKYLLLMTYADVTAVNPHFWTEWKAYLLIGLVKKAINHMRGILEKRLDTADPEINKFLEDMPQRYLISNTLDEMLYDFRMVRQISEHKVLTSINVLADGTAEIVIVTYDMLGLFLRIVRVLSRQGLNIIRARLYSSKSGFVVDKILLSNWSDISWEGLENELTEKLKSGIFDNSNAPHKYANFQNSACGAKFLKGIAKLRLFEHFVEIDNETSSEYSILEITSPDRIGLLYDISSKLYNNNVDITSAIINTEEGIAQDVFYLQCEESKLDSEVISKVMNSLYCVIYECQ
jgi:[protein-PII] uridylyltransferase